MNMMNSVSHTVVGSRFEAIPVTDPALRLMVFSHLSGLRDDRGQRVSASATSGPIARIRELSVSQLTRLVNTMHAPTIAISMRNAGKESPQPPVSPARNSLTYVICDDATTHGEIERIRADDPVLRVMLLSHLVGQSFEHGIQHRAGIDEDTSLNALMGILPVTAHDTPATQARRPPTPIEIRIDLARLNCDVNRYQHLSIDEAQFNYFIKAEASLSMMAELFKASGTAVRKAQMQSGIKTRVGRKCAPDEDTCLCILEAWRIISQEVTFQRDRFHRLHQRFGQFTMAQLYAVVNTTIRRRMS